MSLTIKHSFTSGISDDPAAAAAGKVLPSHWNDDHTINGAAYNTSSPNNTVPVQSLSAVGSETDIDFAIIAKGNGALLAQIPDGTVAAGNKRGTHAVDLQQVREINVHVASGSYSAILSGYANRADNDYCVVAGGQYNGYGASSGSYSVISGGYDNIANGQYSWIGGGKAATTRSIVGMHAHCAGVFTNYGDAQRGVYVLRRVTTDATPTPLTCDAGSVTNINQIILPDSSTYVVTGQVVARRPSNGDSKGWSFTGVIKRGSGAASTALVASVTPTIVATDGGSLTLGETSPFGSASTDNGFIVAARKITVPTGGATLLSLATIITTAAGNGRLALYDASNAGKPGSLIVQTASTALTTGTNTWPVTPTFVAAGDYWIAYQFDNAGYAFTQHTGGPSGDSWFVTSAYVTFPSTFNTTPTGDTVYYPVSGNFLTAAGSWDLAVTADTTNGALSITGTGQASATIQWVATVETTENVG